MSGAPKMVSEVNGMPMQLSGWSVRPGNEAETIGCAEIWFGDHLAARIARGDRSRAVFEAWRACKAEGEGAVAAYCIGLVHGLMMPRPMIGDTQGNVVGEVPGR